MEFMCRFRGHAPDRSKVLLDPYDMNQRTYCKRCGATMLRESQRAWRLEDSSEPIHRLRRAAAGD